MLRKTTTALIFIISFGFIGCAGNVQYRTDYTTCESQNPVEQCADKSIQSYISLSDSEQNYKLGFVEFDDQGQLHDRTQLNKLRDVLYQEASKNNLLMVVFVHGWQNNAEANNDNVESFRHSLMQISKLESQASKLEGRAPRQVFGIYLGWRGLSLEVPIIKYLSFWSRKNTAQTVGAGAVAEVLSRLEEVRDIKTSIDETKPLSGTRLVIIGHSFGGAVVYTALSQIMMERFVQTKGPVGVTSDVRGFGDLVVLINPAFEAMRFSNLSDMANERGMYFPDQRPVMAILTSESDWATKYAFPAGRFFSTLFEDDLVKERINKATRQPQEIDESSANRVAVGHYQPYQTHFLRYAEMAADENELAIYKNVQQGWDNDKPGSAMHFPGSTLTHENNSVGRNPYLLIKVDNKIIPDHSDIYDPRVIEFLRHFILISTQETTAQQRQKMWGK